jgi:hypothetical protein
VSGQQKALVRAEALSADPFHGVRVFRTYWKPTLT